MREINKNFLLKIKLLKNNNKLLYTSLQRIKLTNNKYIKIISFNLTRFFDLCFIKLLQILKNNFVLIFFVFTNIIKLFKFIFYKLNLSIFKLIIYNFYNLFSYIRYFINFFILKKKRYSFTRIFKNLKRTKKKKKLKIKFFENLKRKRNIKRKINYKLVNRRLNKKIFKNEEYINKIKKLLHLFSLLVNNKIIKFNGLGKNKFILFLLNIYSCLNLFFKVSKLFKNSENKKFIDLILGNPGPLYAGRTKYFNNNIIFFNLLTFFDGIIKILLKTKLHSIKRKRRYFRNKIKTYLSYYTLIYYLIIKTLILINFIFTKKFIYNYIRNNLNILPNISQISHYSSFHLMKLVI